MRNKFRAVLVMALLGLFIIPWSSWKTSAMDKNGRFFALGVGQRTCEDYVKFREKRLDTLKHERYTTEELYEIVDKVVEHWIAGFLTAHNYYVTDTYNVLGKESIDGIEEQLEKRCRANEKEYVAEAMIEVTRALHNGRMTAAK